MSDKIRILTQSTIVSVAPDREARCVLTVTNASAIVDRYAFDQQGLPAAWVQEAPAPVALLPGESGTATFVLRPAADAPAGGYPFTLRATSEQNPAEQTSLALSLQVSAVGGYRLQLAPQEARISATAAFTLLVSNPGNAPLTLDLAASDPAGQAQFVLNPMLLALAAQGEATADLQVRLAAPPTQPLTIAFTVSATPREGLAQPQSVEGRLHLMPPTRAWLELAPQQVADPRQGHYAVRLANPGPLPATFRLEASDPAAACAYAFEPALLSVPAGAEANSRLSVQALAWHEGAGPQEITFTVRAVASGETAPTSEPEPVSGKLVQQPRPPLALELLPAQQSAPRRARYRVRITSDRPERVGVLLAASDPADALRLDIRPPRVELRQGSVAEADLTATCKDRLPRGQPRRAHTFTITATPDQGQAAHFDGTLAQTPGRGLPRPGDAPLRILLAIAAVLLGLIACALCAIFARPRLFPPATPTPTPTATARPTAVAQAGCPQAKAPTVAAPPLQVVAVPTTQPAPALGPTRPPGVVPVLSGGFLDLPFPYDGSTTNFGGSDDQFRRAINRSTLGGRVTSYFDHEYPLYPWVFQGMKFYGSEPAVAPIGVSVLAFDGTHLSGDWYTGHPGYDFTPVSDAPNNTPLFAAADGVVHRAYVLGDGNRIVELRHRVSGVGDYLTIYMHMQADAHFQATTRRLGQVVRAGERIGTMGNTGNSTGIHLHFEVRFDANGDGQFDRAERVDPFGFIPLERPDPWAQKVVLRNVQGQDVAHAGIVSRYLWRHAIGVTAQMGSEPVSIDVPRGGSDQADQLAACAPPNTLPPNSTLVVSWAPDTSPDESQAGTGNGCVVSALDSKGQPLSRFTAPLVVSLHYTQEEIRNVDPQSLVIYLFNTTTNTWEPLPTTLDSTRRIASAPFPRPGRCALRGRPTRDILPPRTSISLEGPRDAQGRFTDAVIVRLSATDTGSSGGTTTIRYSIDFGSTWLEYRGPFVVAFGARPVAKQPAGAGGQDQDSVVQDLGEYFVLARAEDRAGNIEQPPAAAGLTMAITTTTSTPSPTRTGTTTRRATPTSTQTPMPPTRTATRVPLTRTATPTPSIPPVPPTRTPTSAPPPVEITFQADRTAIYRPCQCATLSWSVKNAREVYLDNRGVVGVGSQQVCPDKDATYTLRVVSTTGSPDVQRQITIRALYPSIDLRADQTTITSGQATVLRWTVNNVQAVYLDNQPVVGQGSLQVRPPRTQTYVLHVVVVCADTSGYKDQYRNVTINVNTPLPPTPTATPRPPTATPTRTATPCGKLNATLGMKKEGSQVYASWTSSGGCGLYMATLSGRWKDQTSPFQAISLKTASGSQLIPAPPTRCEGTFIAVYTFTIISTDGQTATSVQELSFTYIC